MSKHLQFILSVFILSLGILPFDSQAQVVEEIIQLDTTVEKMQVVYRPTYTTTSLYQKKIAVFPNDTSQVAIEKTYMRGVLNGIYKVYYPSGRLKVKAVYANGNPNGEFTWYDEKGVIRIKGMYKDSVKHGYWAYKYKRIYGRYNKGKKHRKWYYKDPNNQKKTSFYRYGKLVKGDGFGDDKVTQLNNQLATNDTIKQVEPVQLDTTEKEVVLAGTIADEYLQAIDFLKNNFIFRKTIKEHFGANFKDLRLFKKNYTHNIFQFKISSYGHPIGMDHFIAKSKAGNIAVARIDSVIKAEPALMETLFKKEIDNSDLSSHSSKSKTNITIFFSEVKNGLLRIDVLWNKEEKEYSSDKELYQSLTEAGLNFKVLLFYDYHKKLAAAAYQ